ncbi:type I 3-dehydroquinate dehydratase [Dermabacteraceae bacterium TAE3-ERU27]|nr:type I 3-dehydroquinate dehydratase [Dermabacteraceae bacterium TAE3-ERU27]
MKPQLVFSPRHPLIICPVTGGTADEVFAQAERVSDVGGEVIEWRLDHYLPLRKALSRLGESDLSPAALQGAVREIARVCAELAEVDLPVLLTLRSAAEGGALEISPVAYSRLLSALAGQVACAGFDVEALRCHAAPALVETLRSAGHTVLASHHDFVRTPGEEEIVSLLCALAASGADAAKLALTPQGPHDLLALCAATLRASQGACPVPVVTVGMGQAGALTRLGGHLFGSCASFAVASAASAPGQLPVAEVRRAFALLPPAR